MRRALRADPRRWFSAEEITRARAYRRPLHRAAAARGLLGTGVLGAAVLAQAAPRALEAAGIADWRLGTVAVALAAVLGLALVGLPFGAWAELVHERRWRVGRQTARGFLADTLKRWTIAAVLAVGVLLGLWTFVRATPHWWLAGWAGWVGLSAFFAFAAPVVVAPLFNRFRPVSDASLREDAARLGRAAGFRVGDLLVMDASRRTAKPNAYVAGLGRTKRVVLWDTLLEGLDRRAVLAVVAHELGHWRRRHIHLGLAVSAAGALILFAAVREVLAWPAALGLAGVAAASDPGSIPLALGVLRVGSAVLAPAAMWLSRGLERQADADALSLTRDAEAFARMERAIAVAGLVDLAPTRWATLLASHPSPPERLARAEAFREAAAEPPTAAGMAIS